MSTPDFDPIDTYEELLDLRVKLKKYKSEGASKTLAILRRIKKANISKDYIFKIRVTKTIAKLAKLKYEDPSEDEANILKYSQFLTN